MSEYPDERGDLVPLGRLVLWAGLAAFTAFAAVMAGRSEIGSQRIALLVSKLPGPARSIAAGRPAPDPVAVEPAGGQDFGATIASLQADRDRVAARLEALERNLDVTGSLPAGSGGAGRAAVANPAAAPREVPVGRTDFGLELGTGANLEALRSLWATLKGQHAGVLEGLRPLVAIREDAQPGATELRLIAGPFQNAAAAARLCGVLAANGRLCQPVPFEGQRLALR